MRSTSWWCDGAPTAPHRGHPRRRLGQRGTLLTFFAWPATARGRRGVGQATELGLIVPLERIGFWAEATVAYLEDHGAEVHVERLEAGHDLTPDDGDAVAAWLRAHDLEGA